jgi:hypothetical protein
MYGYTSDLDDDDDNDCVDIKPKKILKKISTKKQIISHNKWPGAIIVLDLDGTLIDKQNYGYPNVVKFLTNLQTITKHVYLCLWTMGNDVHCEIAIAENFPMITFDEVRCGSYCDLVGKPVTVIRKNVSNPNCFIGPTIIIDDLDENLAPSQYDIVKDVKKYYKIQNGKIIVDYKQLYQDLLSNYHDWIGEKQNATNK